MNLELIMIGLAAALALGFIGWRVVATFRRKECNSCGCAEKAKRA